MKLLSGPTRACCREPGPMEEEGKRPALADSAVHLGKHMRDVLQNLGEHDPDNRREFKNLEQVAPAAVAAKVAKTAAADAAAESFAEPAPNAEAVAEAVAEAAEALVAEAVAEAEVVASSSSASSASHSSTEVARGGQKETLIYNSCRLCT